VALQQLHCQCVERRLYRGYLRQHIDAVAIVLDHLRDASHLPLDAVQPPEQGWLGGLNDGVVSMLAAVIGRLIAGLSS